MLMVGAVAVKRYHTSCVAAVAQEGVPPLGNDPLKVPVVFTQLLPGVSVVAPEHRSFAGAGNCCTHMVKLLVRSELLLCETRM